MSFKMLGEVKNIAWVSVQESTDGVVMTADSRRFLLESIVRNCRAREKGRKAQKIEKYNRGMDKNQESMEGVARDYKTKRIHGLTDKYIRGTVKLEYQGRIIAKRRYCTRTHRRNIILGWRDEYEDIGSMVLIIEPDNWG